MEMKTEMEIKWVICPVCHNKTRVKVREDTVIKNFLLYCSKCRQENLINISNFQIDVIE